MRFSYLFKAAFLVASLTTVVAHPQRKESPKNQHEHLPKPERVRNNEQKTAGRPAASAAPTVAAKVGSITVLSNTSVPLFSQVPSYHH